MMPEVLGKTLNDEVEKWMGLLKSANIKLD